jgi:hypothetical protein
MQSLVNPGEAKQIEQDYAHTTLASSEMAATTAQATAEAIQAFIQSLRERLRAAQQSEQDPESEAQASQSDDLMDDPPALAEPIEIKMGREIVYREGYAHKDPVNKLNANTLKLLRAAVDAPQPAGAEATTEVKGTINIKAGDDLVYRMSKGAVETNHLAPILESPVEAVDLAADQEVLTAETEQLSQADEPLPAVVQEVSTVDAPALPDELEPVMPEPVSAVEAMPEADVTPPDLPTEVSPLADGVAEVAQPADETVPAVPLASTPAVPESAPQIPDEVTDQVAAPQTPLVSSQADEPLPSVVQEVSVAEDPIRLDEPGLPTPPAEATSAVETVPESDIAPLVLTTEVAQPASETVPVVPLASIPAAPESAPQTPDEVTAEVAEPPPVASAPKPTRGSAQPLVMAAPKVVSILDVLERQAQSVADSKTRQWMQHTTRLMQRSSQQLTERVVALAANIRSRQVASTAVDLLQAYGTTYRPGRGFYVAENYVIKAKGRMVTVSDREGVELMTARKTRWGLDILKNDMVPSQEADFMKARQQIQIQGVAGLSPDPPMRVRQLGNLAPAGDRGITRDLTALALAKTARKLLEVTGSRPNVKGKRVFQGGSQYRIEETPNSLKIQAGERGQILSIDNGKIKTDLTSKDVAYFRFIDRELSQDLQLHAAAKVTPLTRQPRPAMAMGE